MTTRNLILLFFFATLQACAFHGQPNYLRDFAPMNGDGTVNMVVEIPAGTHAKWEVKQDGQMKHDLKQGKKRYVDYLPYPANYGMIPGTIFSAELGGDGDPIDVFLLSSSIPRKTVIAVKPIGMILMKDKGEQDDKVVAVLPGSPMARFDEFKDLTQAYPGIFKILGTWLENYKGKKHGKKKVQVEGWANAEAADELVQAGAKAFQNSSVQ